jgi:NADPH2:quinone reductase
MKAVPIHEYKGPTSVRVEETEVLSPSLGEVRLRVEAAGINNSDLQMTYGKYQSSAEKLPQILGQEAVK